MVIDLGTEDSNLCKSIGCRNLVDQTVNGTTARCRLHLDKQTARQAEYRARKRERENIDKDKLLRFEKLQEDYDELIKNQNLAKKKAMMYDELKRRYDTLLKTYKATRPN